MLVLLVLVIGPLQAQTAFACEMMDRVMLGECCCEAHVAPKDCVDSDCGAAVDSGGDPCCDRSVEITIDDDARQDTPLVKPVEVPSDVDPPQAIAAACELLILSQSLVALGEFQSRPIAGQSGSDTYLITRRLRI